MVTPTVARTTKAAPSAATVGMSIEPVSRARGKSRPVNSWSSGESLEMTRSISFPAQSWFARAAAEVPAGQGIGFTSMMVDHLTVLVDAADQVVEFDDLNNAGPWDDVSAFPWDVVDNGSVMIDTQEKTNGKR